MHPELIMIRSDHDLISLFEHDLFGKPVPTFPDHAVVDVAAAIGDRIGLKQAWVGVTMRIRTAAISVALAVLVSGAAFSLVAAGAEAQTASPGMRTAQASPPAADEPPPVRRPTKRLRIYPRDQAEPDDVYPRYYPGQNAVRECNATYVQEYRPSGTVIVPRMSCHWRRG
jgi:hypothetical protein